MTDSVKERAATELGPGERGPHFPIFQNEHLFDIMKIRLAMPARSGGWRLRGRIHPVRRKIR
ncbi:MAG: hypothetical protein C6P37_12415 [Caldibacillus debilis]|uniref:Uncharacterized protein n=1 Tax=Caldibacillus debilis TaxID=301148 RepID=A0A3E0K1I0_9BACI|nr:MAG: hypothetical protein C6W57_08330 [Caldibacillus debilis]REJ26870.1 MAG: hypothetical protein C6P37_12415 [Caldibacillus debilis]REJ30520.1 MAG: hypothetical protein C6W56_02520 [Caldibacillus debilis]